jgi:hypothetical protein
MAASSFAFAAIPAIVASRSSATFGIVSAVAVPSTAAISSLASTLRCGPFTWTESLTSVPVALAGVTSTFGAENSADTVSWS